MSKLHIYNLHEYQKQTVNHLIRVLNAMLWLGLGLGKTISTLTAFDFLKTTGQTRACLVIAPLRVCQLVWRQEADKWSHTNHLTFSNMTGTAEQRTRGLFKKADIYLINYESLSWLATTLQQHFINYGRPLPFDMLVFDEVSKVKRSMSKRFAAFAPFIPYFTRRIGLTASPCSNGLHDLWGQFYMIDGGQRLGTDYPTFQSAFFHQVGRAKYNKWEPYTDTKDMIVNRIRDITVEMKASDHLPDMPAMTTIDVVVPLPPRKKKLYKELERNFFIELDHGGQLEVFNKAALSNKLLQFSNGIVYNYLDPEDPDSMEEEFIHEEKYKALDEIVKGSGDDPILLAYSFASERRELMKRYPYAECLTGAKEHQAIDIMNRFNAGKIKLLIAHPQCLEGDTEVLTEFRGWIKIVDVQVNERVFDGVEFATHRGCSYSGYADIIDTFDIGMTLNHKILINDEWTDAQNVGVDEGIREEACYSYKGDDSYIGKMCSLRENFNNIDAKHEKAQCKKIEILPALYKRHACKSKRQIEGTCISHMEGYGSEVNRSIGQKLLWSWNFCVRALVKIPKLLRRYEANIQSRINNRACQCKQRLQQAKLRMDNDVCAAKQQTYHPQSDLPRAKNTSGRAMQNDRVRENGVISKIEQRYVRGSGCSRRSNSELFSKKQKTHNITRRPSDMHFVRTDRGIPSDNITPSENQNNRTSYRKAHVYDLVDCGKRTQFLIRNKKGEMFISHNSAGHGLNLQEACNIVVWFGLNYNLELYEQFNGRIDRQGQPNPVRCLRIVCEDTMDFAVMDALLHKDETQSAMRDAINRRRI